LPINIPNALTLMRIMLIPVLVVVFYLPFKNHLTVAAIIFAVAAITDWLDGYLARRLGQMTAFGAFLDPVADKLMVIGKVKTVFQMVAITALLAIDPARDENWMLALCYLVLYSAAVLTLWSMLIYLKAAWVIIKDRSNSL